MCEAPSVGAAASAVPVATFVCSRRRRGGAAPAQRRPPPGDSAYAHLVTSGRRVLATVLALSSVVAFVGCGGSSASRTGTAQPATRPGGASAHAVYYHCHSGRRGTIAVSLPNPRSLAQVLNPIDVCEFDGGLAGVVLRVRCSDAAPETELRITAVHGRLPPSTARTICS